MGGGWPGGRGVRSGGSAAVRRLALRKCNRGLRGRRGNERRGIITSYRWRGILLATKYSDETPGGGRSGSVSTCAGTRIHCRTNGQRDPGPVGFQQVGANLVEIYNHPGDGRIGAIQAHAHGAHAVIVDRDMFLPGSRQGIGQLEHQPVGVTGSNDGGIDRCAERDLDAHAVAVAHYFHILHRGGARGRALPRCQRHQQQENSKLSLYCRHSLSSLAGAPLAAGILRL